MSRLLVKGSSEYLEITAGLWTVYPLTLACWFYPTNLDSTSQTIICGADNTDANRSQRLQITASNLLGATSHGGSLSSTANAGAVTANTWTHGAAVFSSATSRKVSKNGGTFGSSSTNISMNGAPNRTSIGRRANSTPANYFSGRVEHVAIWNTDLTQAEVTALAVGQISPLAIRRANLVAYVPCLGDQSPEFDLVAGRSWAVTGTVKANGAPAIGLLGWRRNLTAPVLQFPAAGTEMPDFLKRRGARAADISAAHPIWD